MMTNGNRTIGNLLNTATKKLSENSYVVTPRLDAEILLAYVLQCTRLDLVLSRDKQITVEQEKVFFKFVERRFKNEPVSYLTHSKEFMSLDFHVEPGILIPRPDTEMIVEYIIEQYKAKDNISILDLCTGSGAIAVSLAHYLENADITAVDKFDTCIKVATQNAERHGCNHRVHIMQADVLRDLSFEQKFHCIVSNPPYINAADFSTLSPDVKSYEPKYALYGGVDGLDFYKKIISIAIDSLHENGILVFEIGYDQGYLVKNLIEKTKKFHTVCVTKDLAKNDRMVTAIKGENAYDKII